MDLLACPILLLVDLVDSLGRRIVDVSGLCGLGNVQSLLVNEVDEELALHIWDRYVFLGHGGQFLLSGCIRRCS